MMIFYLGSQDLFIMLFLTLEKHHDVFSYGAVKFLLITKDL